MQSWNKFKVERCSVAVKMFLLVVLISAGTLVRSSNSMAINSSELVTSVASGNFKDCFTSAGLVECFKSVAVQTLNRAIDSNVAIQVTRFLVIKKNPDYQPDTIEERTPHISWATVLSRIRDFISSRTFQLSLTTRDGVSSLLPSLTPEGRGKKHKHKQQGGMYMMGGVAFMAMVAQLVLGKVALLAAMALIMAKIALVFSTLVNNLGFLYRSLRSSHRR